MNIEQEFKEIHELLLACYDEDYEESLEKALGKLDNLKKAITVTRCSTQLKDKKAPTFEHWLICNFEETKSGKYIDFNNGDTYRDKHILKLNYNKIFKQSL